MPQQPTIGRIVHYKLSEQDAAQINKRRDDAKNPNLKGVTLASRELGAQIHTGNHVEAGDVYPAMIVRTWGAESHHSQQLQVFLDGNDTFWATSVSEGQGDRQWQWPQTGVPARLTPGEFVVNKDAAARPAAGSSADQFLAKAKASVARVAARYEPDELYIVWFCKVLGNWKALVSTDSVSGVYWEVTYNGAKKETYVDTYKKAFNDCIPDVDV